LQSVKAFIVKKKNNKSLDLSSLSISPDKLISNINEQERYANIIRYLHLS